MTKRVGVSESLPDGTCPDNGSPRLCLPDESNEEALLHQNCPKSKKEKQDIFIMIRIREGSVYQQMRRSGHTKRKRKVNHILLWMNRSHHKGKNRDSDFDDGSPRFRLQDEPNEEENNLTTSMMFIEIYNLIINLL